MDNNFYKIENEEGLSFSIQKVLPESMDKDGRHDPDMQLVFLVDGISRRDLTKDGDLVLTMGKAEAFCLAVKIMSLCDNELCYVMDGKLIRLSCGIDKVEIKIGGILRSLANNKEKTREEE